MSDNLNGKDYAEYFARLERELEVEPKKAKAIPVTLKTERKVKRLKKTKPLKRALAFVLVICVGLFVWRVVKGINPKTAEAETYDKKIVQSEKKDSPKKNYFARLSTNVVELPQDSGSENIIVVNTTKNEIVAQKNYNVRCYPASTTKIMTVLVAAEMAKDLNDTFEMTFEITNDLYIEEASVVGFLPGEKVTIKDMIYGAILPSGADATVGLAIKLAGSEEAFCELMNKKAKELGLKDTHFTNTSGLFDENHYTTAEDMAVILRAAMDNKICKAALSTYKYTTAKTKEHPDGIEITSTLFKNMYGTEPKTATILGGKTGYVNESGYCIATFGESENGDEYVCVNIKSEGRVKAVFEQIDLYKTYAK